MSLTPATRATLDAVKAWNDERADDARVWAAILYLFIGLGMIMQTFIVALLHAWWAPLPWLRFLPYHRDMRLVTAYWFYPFLAFNFVLTAGGGMPGWMVAGFVFTVWTIFVVIRGVCIRRNTRNADAAPGAEGMKPGHMLEWTHLPDALGRRQFHLLVLSVITFIACFVFVMISVFTFELKEYRLVERNPVVAIAEFQPEMTAKTIQLMYAWEGLATDMRLAIYVKITTDFCGTNFKKKVTDKEIIQRDWIQKYNINMTWYVVEDYRQFESVNDWFVRHIKPSMRPIAEPNNPLVVTSPADARLLVFYNRDASKVWIKGGKFTLNRLIDGLVVDGDPNYYEEGVIVICRLAPQDYHRFHSPVDGTVDYVKFKSGTYWSVNADAAQSGNYAFLNARQIMVLDTGGPLGKVAFVGVGATCVGSVILQNNQGTLLQPGMKVKKGDEVGFMQFGGSTIILLFKKNTMKLDCDLVQHSALPVETYIPMGARVGIANTDGSMPTCP
eukprot:PhM_4_TR6798/c0_g2_i1/m.103347/K01613/psd, PISD; phosphatidylserine decarboxylase